MISFISEFNVSGTTVKHFMDSFGEMYFVTAENGAWEYWCVDRPQRGQIYRAPILGPTIIDTDAESLQNPLYYYAGLKQGRLATCAIGQSMAYENVPAVMVYEVFIDQCGPELLRVSICVAGELVVTDSVVEAIVRRLSDRHPECSKIIIADYARWLHNCSTPELAAAALQNEPHHPTILGREGVMFLRSRQPFMDKAGDGTYDSEQQIDQDERVHLQQALHTCFDVDELKQLCFEMGIEYEDLPTTKTSLARELVRHCQRNGRLSELEKRVRQKRPNAL